MKTHAHSMLDRSGWMTLLTLAAAPFVWGQAPPVDPPEPEEPPRVIVREAGRQLEPLAPPGAPPAPPLSEDVEAGWRIDLRRAGQSAQRAIRDVERHVGAMRFGYTGPDARRLLVIPNANATDDAVAERRKELAIMATILDRAARPDRPRRPDVLFELDGWRSGTGRELEAMLLDGYGAVFLLGVDYPLVKPPTDLEPPAKKKKSADNTWERTRRELLGQDERDEDDIDVRESASAERTYNEQRVDELQERLIKALAHASNIQGLDSDQWIVVQVTGRTPQGRSMDVASSSPDGRYITTHRREPRGASVLTLRVKKSAVDAFAAERMTLEEFSRAVEVSRRLEKPATKP